MLNPNADVTLPRESLFPKLMLAWYVTFFLLMAMAPVDPKIWYAQNVLPVLFVSMLVLTHRTFPLSSLSYLLFTIWLTLHTVAVHYTYPKVPFGFWLEQWFNFHRNHFDRIVHFSFGLLWTYPLIEIFRRKEDLKGWILPYMSVMTILGFSACWEIFEAWVGQIAHPNVEMAFIGQQGDIWDPQRDIAAALYGSLVCIVLLKLLRWLREPSPVLETAPASSDPVSDI
jgi:putative membrane protein